METAKEQRLGSSSQLEPFSSLSSSYAPWYDVPRRSIVSVEHPFIIGNVEKGVKSLGGAVKMQEVGPEVRRMENLKRALT